MKKLSETFFFLLIWCSFHFSQGQKNIPGFAFLAHVEDNSPSRNVNLPFDKSIHGMETSNITMCMRLYLRGAFDICPVSQVAGITVIFRRASKGIGFIELQGEKAKLSYMFVSTIGRFPMNQPLNLCVQLSQSDKKTSVKVNANLEIWLNNSFEGSKKYPETFRFSSSFHLGPSENSTVCKHFKGYITDVNIWSRLLTNNEIRRFLLNVDEGKTVDQLQKVFDWSVVGSFEFNNSESIIKNSYTKEYYNAQDFIQEHVRINLPLPYKEARDFC